MEIVYILKWTGSERISRYAYTDPIKAQKMADEANTERSIFHRICGDRWVVKELKVK